MFIPVISLVSANLVSRLFHVITWLNAACFLVLTISVYSLKVFMSLQNNCDTNCSWLYLKLLVAPKQMVDLACIRAGKSTFWRGLYSLVLTCCSLCYCWFRPKCLTSQYRSINPKLQLNIKGRVRDFWAMLCLLLPLLFSLRENTFFPPSPSAWIPRLPVVGWSTESS